MPAENAENRTKRSAGRIWGVGERSARLPCAAGSGRREERVTCGAGCSVGFPLMTGVTVCGVMRDGWDCQAQARAVPIVACVRPIRTRYATRLPLVLWCLRRGQPLSASCRRPRNPCWSWRNISVGVGVQRMAVPEQNSVGGFSPSDFMRARRPELFSDSVATTDEPPLDRAQLEFHLDTLTQRKEETRFEHFSRRLAEKELCPNLLPQTGPTGGGDSKVDSETYPVSSAIAQRWYEGDPERSSAERWAFAFSAKKKWRDKVKSDIAEIVATRCDWSFVHPRLLHHESGRPRSEQSCS